MTTPTPPATLADALGAVVGFFERAKVPYFLLGGIALGALGEPRFTLDVDLDIHIPKTAAKKLLVQAQRAGFRIAKSALQDVTEFGVFRMWWNDVQIDCILASTPLEQSAFKRRTRVKVLETTVWLPSVEDLLLLKIISGRDKDLVDARTLVERHTAHLDKKYLEQWAQHLCDEAEDYRIMHTLRAVLK